MKRIMKMALTGVALGSALTLTGCMDTGPTFTETCESQEGVVMSDSTSRLMSGTISGTVFTDKGSGFGTGYASSYVTITMDLCVVDGKVVDMEVR